jgi:DNA-binding response OmpR family regulator
MGQLFRANHTQNPGMTKAKGGNVLPERSRNGKESGDMKAVRKKRILVVDDDREVVESVRVALETLGYEVHIARNGADGAVLAGTEQPDMVIVDMVMPQENGFQFLERVREGGSQQPVIMITANESPRFELHAHLMGVTDYLRKPFAMRALVASIEKNLA